MSRLFPIEIDSSALLLHGFTDPRVKAQWQQLIRETIAGMATAAPAPKQPKVEVAPQTAPKKRGRPRKNPLPVGVAPQNLEATANKRREALAKARAARRAKANHAPIAETQPATA